MSILVTGGAGFIGSRLVGRLLAAGETVHVVDDLSLGRREQLPAASPSSVGRLHVAVMDVRAPEFTALVEKTRPTRVWHLAANSDIGAGTKSPQVDLERTFLTTFHVVDAMRRAQVKELVFASTSAIYGEADGALTEDHGPLQPISLYGAAKLAGEGYVSAACHLFGVKAWVFRFPNVVGPNLTHGVIHDFVARLLDTPDVLRVLGDGSQEKPYLDVDDLLDAMQLAVSTSAAQGAAPLAVYNIAGDGATRVRDIAELVRDELHNALSDGRPPARIEYGSGNRGWPGDVPRFAYDTSRIRALGWRPRLSSTEAVRAAIRAEIARARACRR